MLTATILLRLGVWRTARAVKKWEAASGRGIETATFATQASSKSEREAPAAAPAAHCPPGEDGAQASGHAAREAPEAAAETEEDAAWRRVGKEL